LWRDEAARAVDALGIKLAVYRIGPGGELRDPEKDWTRRVGVPLDGAILLRPDGFVAWRSHHGASAPGPLEKALRQILFRSPSTTDHVGAMQTVSR
jgi:putative polyketide hydroxylase